MALEGPTFAFRFVSVHHRHLRPTMDETLCAPSIERLLLDGWETTNLGTATVRFSFLSGPGPGHAKTASHHTEGAWGFSPMKPPAHFREIKYAAKPRGAFTACFQGARIAAKMGAKTRTSLPCIRARLPAAPKRAFLRSRGFSPCNGNAVSQCAARKCAQFLAQFFRHNQDPRGSTPPAIGEKRDAVDRRSAFVYGRRKVQRPRLRRHAGSRTSALERARGYDD